MMHNIYMHDVSFCFLITRSLCLGTACNFGVEMFNQHFAKSINPSSAALHVPVQFWSTFTLVNIDRF